MALFSEALAPALRGNAQVGGSLDITKHHSWLLLGGWGCWVNQDALIGVSGHFLNNPFESFPELGCHPFSSSVHSDGVSSKPCPTATLIPCFILFSPIFQHCLIFWKSYLKCFQDSVTIFFYGDAHHPTSFQQFSLMHLEDHSLLGYYQETSPSHPSFFPSAFVDLLSFLLFSMKLPPLSAIKTVWYWPKDRPTDQ